MTKAKSNIVLIGFMACGKSRIGSIIAERLGYALLDLDAIIEHQEGMSIKEIFEQKGEAYFRNIETKTIADLKEVARSVIVTGGGAPVFFDNAQMLSQLGHVFYLDANFAVLEKRLKKSKKRPLGTIAHKEDLANIKNLYLFRRPIYSKLGHAIDVNSEDKELISNDIIERFNALQDLEPLPQTMIEGVDDRYPLYHQSGALTHLGTIISSLGLSSYQPVIVTTHHLAQTLSAAITHIQKSLAKTPLLITFNDGEHHKNFSSINLIHEQMFAHGLTRKTMVIALGGGNVGDVAGFAAGMYVRGVPFIQIPTTLLAMTDASIGGKTGVDNQFGKNLVGLFYNPKAVIIDPSLLTTLPKEDFACGMAEIIKHGLIGDKELFYALNNTMDMNEIITRAIKVKADIVFMDPKEHNIRAYLNLGHTFAHAIEKVSNFTIKHGMAVAIGLMLATKLSKRLGMLEEDFELDLHNLLKRHGLPTELPNFLLASDLLSAMKHDKKRDTRGLKFIVPIRVGEVVSQYVDDKDIF